MRHYWKTSFEIDNDLYTEPIEKDIELLVQMYNIFGEIQIEDTYKSPYKDDLFCENSNKLKGAETLIWRLSNLINHSMERQSNLSKCTRSFKEMQVDLKMK